MNEMGYNAGLKKDLAPVPTMLESKK
jgi:hypothetical protein